MFDEDLFDAAVEEDPKVLLLLDEDTNAYPEAAGRARREMKLENFILFLYSDVCGGNKVVFMF